MASSSWPIIKSNRKKNIESDNDKLSPPTASAVDSRYLRLLPEVEPYLHDENSDNFSYADLECLPDFLLERSEEILDLRLEYNSFKEIPPEIGSFKNLVYLDISNNRISNIASEIIELTELKSFICRNNNLSVDSIPKDFGLMKSLTLLNVSGNSFSDVPMQFTELNRLKSLYIGGNEISNIPREIGNLKKLEILYLGGNRLKVIPTEVGQMESLVSLVLSDNYIEQLPNSLARLKNLQSLGLHNNRLSTLPPELIRLNLVELSLRNNPLVVRFVQDLTYEPPTLKELAGRTIKVKNISYAVEDLPVCLIEYLASGNQCVNPKCKGVYFSSCVEQIKFVDFCGKYRLPLMQYLCSPKCTSSPLVPYSSSESDSEEEMQPLVNSKMKKVLLG